VAGLALSSKVSIASPFQVAPTIVVMVGLASPVRRAPSIVIETAFLLAVLACASIAAEKNAEERRGARSCGCMPASSLLQRCGKRLRSPAGAGEGCPSAWLGPRVMVGEDVERMLGGCSPHL
jgi:hypothetical protein